VEIVLGGGVIDRHLEGAVALLRAYREDEGTRYLNQVPITPPDRLVPEDLAVTILINSRVTWRAYKSVQDLAPALDLGVLPATPLEGTSAAQRALVADVVAQVAHWPGFAASVASKVLHKKRAALVPLLDNSAIFGAYMNPVWPAVHSSADSVKDIGRIREALDSIWFDLTRPENTQVWSALSAQEPTRTRIELFDMVWWSHFRGVEPR